ncbi:MAG: response regulator [Balneolaceae bacterium]|nr:response regulator [Balneolaceae bacterium]
MDTKKADSVTKRVLIVEDEAILAMTVEQMIRKMGHEVVDKVSSGEEAVTAAIEQKPDLILMDIRLRGKMNGIEAVSKIRKQMQIPVIYLTGNTDYFKMAEDEPFELTGVLRKPVSYHALHRSFDFAS